MRLIDADALKIPSEEMIAKMIIDSAPSIDIVRCGECIYWKNSLCQAWHRVIPKDGYCSIGEREGE